MGSLFFNFIPFSVVFFFGLLVWLSSKGGFGRQRVVCFFWFLYYVRVTFTVLWAPPTYLPMYIPVEYYIQYVILSLDDRWLHDVIYSYFTVY